MKKYLFFVIIVYMYPSFAQNPIIRDQFSADPSARVFNGRVYVFPSHDIPVLADRPFFRKNWFCMVDYHVFSSENLVDLLDHGVILTQYQVPWVDSTAYAFWAPDCIEKNEKYYFYFPAVRRPSDSTGRRMFSIGVAIADNPEGPYIPQPEPIRGVHGIDPNVFIDKDGQAYLYWSMRNIYVAKLKENMIDLDSEPKVIEDLPEKGLKEGPWVFERNGIYYLTFPHVENKIERLEYAMSCHPRGPFTMAGVIMDESPMNCWTNHHSIIDYKRQWYLLYHQNYLSPHFDKNRSVCVDSLFFNTDGTIRKVIPTHRGVGVTKASQQIEIDRYSQASEEGISIALNDSLNSFKGWKTIFHNKRAWIQYNGVDFGKEKFKEVDMKVFSNAGNSVEIRLDGLNGKTIAKVVIPESKDCQMIRSKVSEIKPGIHSVFLISSGENPVEVDWITFR